MAAVTAAETAATVTNTAAQTANAAATGAAAGAQTALNAAMKANIWAAVASLIIAAVTAVVSYVKNIETLDDKLQEIDDKYDDAIQAAEERAKASEQEEVNVKRLAERYEQLRLEYERTGNRQKELDAVAKELQQTVPELGLLIDEQTGKYKALGDEINNVVDAMRRQREIEKNQAGWNAAMDVLDEKTALYEEAKNKFNSYVKENGYIEQYGFTPDELAKANDDKLVELYTAMSKIGQQMKEAEDRVAMYEAQISDIYSKEEAENAEEAALPVAEYVNQYVQSMKNRTAQSFDEYYAWINDRFAEFEQKYNELKDSLDVGDIDDNAYRQGLNSLLDEYGINGLDIYQKYFKELKKLNNQHNKEVQKQNETAAKEQQKAVEDAAKEHEKALEEQQKANEEYYKTQAQLHNKTVEEMSIFSGAFGYREGTAEFS